MLTRLHHAHARSLARLAGFGPVGIAAPQARGKTTAVKRKSGPSTLDASSDVARQLEKTGVWKRSSGRRKNGGVTAVEPRRVNIVSESLCDDIVEYIGPSLERHRGCDLVDLNPGAGVWSRALHSFLEPRKHIMMDLDADLYRPFLAPLLARDNVQLLPRSGIVWKDLLQVIRTQLADQRETAEGAAPVRNDTLLVTANLSTFPKKSFNGFDSISTMVMYQLMSSIHTSSLFQRYGLVRMLVWINDEDTRRLLPRSINRRKRSAFEAELSCEWLQLVAGVDAEFEDRHSLRDDWINTESACRTLERMAAQGLTMPAGRETRAWREVKAKPALMGKRLAGVRPPSIARPFKQELEDLEHDASAALAEDASKRLRTLRLRDKTNHDDALLYLDLLQEHEGLGRLAAADDAGGFERANAEWNERIDNLKKNARNEFNIIKDNYHLFRQDPQALLWDRRAYEPLAVRAQDFFPNAPAALLDIQPKAMHPLFRQHGPASTRSGDMSEVMLRFWFHQTLLPVQRAMEGLWGGFGELVAQCPSVRDAARGGTPVTGHGALTVRAMNEAQWAEILAAWMDWPFRPSYAQMLGRLVEDADSDDDDENKPGAMGLGS